MKVLVVVASGLHLGYLGCYGNEWVHTPIIDRLAAEGIVFDQHYADEPDAAGPQRAWQTGCYRFPSAKAEDESLVHEGANIFPLVAEQGIETFLIRVDKARSLATKPAGWRRFHLTDLAQERTILAEQLSADLTKALGHLTSCRQWLLRLDLSLLLPPWNTPDEFSNRCTSGALQAVPSPGVDRPSCGLEESEEAELIELQDRYADLVNFLDIILGQALEQLDKRGLLDETLILLTADRGQTLGEDATRTGSPLWLHEELIHIPLIVRLPGKAEAGRRISALTQPVDLLPTIFDAFGLLLPAVHGQSLLPLARGKRAHIRNYACSGLRRDDAVEWALRTLDWAFLLPVSSPPGDSPKEPRLYVKPDDRWEVNDVRQHHLELAERLEQALRGFVEATRRPGPLPWPELPVREFEQDRIANPSEGGIVP